ncbi:MAG: hypothetical protein WDO70_03265 [Alphaproteobacteria bacterium]
MEIPVALHHLAAYAAAGHAALQRRAGLDAIGRAELGHDDAEQPDLGIADFDSFRIDDSRGSGNDAVTAGFLFVKLLL